jgi:hypothetical protein
LAFPIAVDPSQHGLPQTETPLHLRGATKDFPMMDVLMLALTFGWFALAIGYAYACERL